MNFSNHPHSKWDRNQTEAASKFGDIIDIPFPEVPAEAGENAIYDLAKKCVEQIESTLGDDGAVMVQGEFSLTYAVVTLLKQKGIKALSACSERLVTEEVDENGERVRKVRFEFKRFREY
ncbi:MAG: hypothetical protein K6G10_04845 [Butyrivibrio sp.]|nr:hypothetical protein [Butyrivibrio sp.]